LTFHLSDHFNETDEVFEKQLFTTKEERDSQRLKVHFTNRTLPRADTVPYPPLPLRQSACSVCGALIAHVTTCGGDDDMETHRKWHQKHEQGHKKLESRVKHLEDIVRMWMDAGVEELLTFERWPSSPFGYEVDLRTRCGCAECTKWLVEKGAKCRA
jgi:hypothetical protein